MRTRVRCIEPADRKRVLAAFGKARNLVELRTRAIVLLAWGAGLRLKEVCALNLTQVLEEPKAKTLGRIRSSAYLQPKQSKGRRRGNRAPWDSAGAFVITKPARVALRQYLRAAQRAGWIAFPAPDNAPLFHASGKGRAGGKIHRISRRTAQHAWTELQKTARIANGYRFHDLRHDALTRFAEAAAGDVFRVARFGRCDPYTALHYVHSSPVALVEIAERAAARKAVA